MTVSIIIPSYQHARSVGQAIESALAQTVPCEVIVVDDGSIDDTADVLAAFVDRIRVIFLPHGGPSVARNAGLDAATGEFVMFLDADDVLHPRKVERQLRAFTPDVGWVLCDVRIEDAAARAPTTASARYGYAAKNLADWIQPALTEGNFIPIMSPLVRRSVLAGIRFRDDRVPEDWHFWHAVAGNARVRYVPEVLATYRKSLTGRSRTPKAARQVSNTLTAPLRLNLGCGTKGTESWHPIDGLVNLDKSLGWCFEDGLGAFVDGSVAGITVSHALMYLPLDRWPALFREFARVLQPGGVLRITEDDAINPASERYGGWRGSQPRVTLTDAALVRQHMERVGLAVHDVTATTTRYRDRSLMQAHHGQAPTVFFIEGERMPVLLFEPHADDAVLFATFSILKYRPSVVTCFGSRGDYGTTEERARETADAMAVIGGVPLAQWEGDDLVGRMRELDDRLHPTLVLAPNERASHPDHIATARAARAVFGERLRTFHTYDADGKVRAGQVVPYETEWVAAKLRAMLRYESQLRHPRACQFFTWDLLEYLE